jgi:hypothetical protein
MGRVDVPPLYDGSFPACFSSCVVTPLQRGLWWRCDLSFVFVLFQATLFCLLARARAAPLLCSCSAPLACSESPFTVRTPPPPPPRPHYPSHLYLSLPSSLSARYRLSLAFVSYSDLLESIHHLTNAFCVWRFASCSSGLVMAQIARALCYVAKAFTRATISDYEMH